MSGLAFVAREWGAEVAGSDRARSSYVDRLEAAGVPVTIGPDPAFLIGGEIPQLGGNARAGEGWLVAEGDESDRSLELLRPQIAALTNVELDHHATYASEDEVRELFERWLAAAPAQVRGDELQ